MTSTNSCPAIATEKMSAAIEFGLIPEIWEQIFKMLDFPNLLTVRSTCLRWKQIVDGSAAIMARWKLKINQEEFDRDFQPTSVVPARSVELVSTRISCIGPWWALLGENLMHLHLDRCQISSRMLLKILQQTPNLKSLTYWSNYFETDDICTENICLNKLERLEVNGNILNIFRKICPQVKSFSARQCVDPNKLVQYLESSNEIVELDLDCYGFFEYVLNNRKNLQLPNVRSLQIDHSQLSDEEIGDIFPEVTSLLFRSFAEEVTPKFFNKIKHLEKLSIIGYNAHKINFSVLKPQHNLMELNLTGVDLYHTSLHKFIQDTSTLCRLTLTRCECLSLVFASIELKQSIEYMSLNYMKINETPSEYLDSLKCLKMREIWSTKKIIKTLIKLCPQLNEIELAEIYFGDNKNIDDEVMQVLCQKLKYLEKLTIKQCSMTDQSVEHIVNNCTELKRLKIVGNHSISDDGRRKLSRYIKGLHPSNSRVEIVQIPA